MSIPGRLIRRHNSEGVPVSRYPAGAPLAQAVEEFERAAALAGNERERRFLHNRAAAARHAAAMV
ncbi:MAG TPA: hypothetical protein VHB68_06930 [Steroidobacteraceae bacterium]|nr:hypothetical protein [Steroidobacteraceae bacterium]